MTAQPVEGLSERDIGGLSPMEFDEAEYPEFVVEVALAGKEREDYVVHFFPPKWPNDERLRTYWLDVFPVVLSDEAQRFFNAGPPTLVAKYTDENASWWFRAYGQAKTVFVTERILKFLQELSDALSNKISNQ